MKHNWKITGELLMWIVICIVGAFVLYNPLVGTMGGELTTPDGIQSWQFGLMLLVFVAVGGVVWSFLLKKFKMKYVGWVFALMLANILMKIPSNLALEGVELWSGNHFAIMFLIWSSYLFIIYAIRVVQVQMMAGKLAPYYFWSNFVFAGATVIVGLSIGYMLGPIVAVCFLAGAAIYDAWAVWKSKTMIGLVKGLASHGIYPGLIVPKKDTEIGFAILGGGDIFFMVATAFAFYAVAWQATVLTMLGMFLAVIWLFIFGKNKFYPALPFILAGCVVGLGVTALIGVPLW